MTEENSDNKLKRIHIKTESGSKWFETGQDFIAWVNEQKNIYSFFNNVQNRHNEYQLSRELARHWQQLIDVSDQLSQQQADEEQYATTLEILVNEFQKKLKAKEIFTSDASFAGFVQELAKKNPNVAAAALAYFMDFNLNNWDMDVARGVQTAIDWERDFSGRVEQEESSLQSMKDSWDGEFNRQRDEADKTQQRLECLCKRADTLIKAQQKRFDSSVESYDERLEKALDEANAKLENITRTYDEKLALHSAVRYWGLQEKYHKKRSIGFGVVTAIVAGLVLWGIYEYAKYFLDMDIKTIPVSRLVTMAIITTFGIWAVRLSANLFMAHTHLKTDAHERRTMMHTYLSLLRKGEGPKDDERQLILQTLFRPGTTGMIKEDAGPGNLVNMLNRLSSRN